MAQIVQLSQRELKRAAAAAYEGRAIRVMLCNVGATGYNAESTVADWQSVELSGNGYARFSGTVGTGAYDNTEAAYILPDVDVAFSATGSGLSFDRWVTYFNGETYVHSVIIESPSATIAAEQTITNRISLGVDD